MGTHLQSLKSNLQISKMFQRAGFRAFRAASGAYYRQQQPMRTLKMTPVISPSLTIKPTALQLSLRNLCLTNMSQEDLAILLGTSEEDDDAPIHCQSYQ